MKEGIRILGVDDAAFEFEDEETFLTGVVYRGTEFIEDIKTRIIKVDGEDATEAVVSLFEKCSNPRQIKAILIDGVSFAGFNIVDLEEVAEKTDKPVIAVTSNEPEKKDFKDAMQKSGNYDEKFEQLPDYRELEREEGKIYFQFAGCRMETAKSIIETSLIHGLVPEPIRVAHLIGRAVG